MLDSDASSAKSLVLAALILEAVFFGIGIFIFVLAMAGSAVSGATLGALGIIATVFTVLLSIGLLWLLLDYYLIYRPIALERVAEAETSAIVLGILQLIFAGIIPGILLIIAYVKIRDSVENMRRARPYAPA